MDDVGGDEQGEIRRCFIGRGRRHVAAVRAGDRRPSNSSGRARPATAGSSRGVPRRSSPRRQSRAASRGSLRASNCCCPDSRRSPRPLRPLRAIAGSRRAVDPRPGRDRGIGHQAAPLCVESAGRIRPISPGVQRTGEHDPRPRPVGRRDHGRAVAAVADRSDATPHRRRRRAATATRRRGTRPARLDADWLLQQGFLERWQDREAPPNTVRAAGGPARGSAAPPRSCDERVEPPQVGGAQLFRRADEDRHRTASGLQASASVGGAPRRSSPPDVTCGGDRDDRRADRPRGCGGRTPAARTASARRRAPAAASPGAAIAEVGALRPQSESRWSRPSTRTLRCRRSPGA